MTRPNRPSVTDSDCVTDEMTAMYRDSVDVLAADWQQMTLNCELSEDEGSILRCQWTAAWEFAAARVEQTAEQSVADSWNDNAYFTALTRRSHQTPSAKPTSFAHRNNQAQIRRSEPSPTGIISAELKVPAEYYCATSLRYRWPYYDSSRAVRFILFCQPAIKSIVHVY